MDGRLVLTYGYRKRIKGPTSIRARISADDGATWGGELILRSGGGDEDIGYTRNALRPDGKIVTIYYWQENEKAERDIAATIWTPPSATSAGAAASPAKGATMWDALRGNSTREPGGYTHLEEYLNSMD